MVREFNLNEKQMKQFSIYYHLLKEWNKKINLTAIVEKEEIYIRHFYDSLYASKVYDFENQFVCDIGSGAGFPGIPLKILFPDIKLTIIDALNKRVKFLKELCDQLDIEVTLVHARAEDYIKDSREKYDVVFARAVAKLNVLAELCIPYVKVNGLFLAYKGQNALNEIRQTRNALRLLNSKVEDRIKYTLPNVPGQREIIKIRKLKKNDIMYPRQFAKIKKRPL